MGKPSTAKAGKSSSPPSQPRDEELVADGLAFLEAQSRLWGPSDACSDEVRSLRSAKSMVTGLSSNRGEQTGVPFPIAPEVREDQSLPPWIPVKGNKTRQGKVGNGGRGGRRGNKSGGEKGRGGGNNGSENGCPPEVDTDCSLREDDISSRVEELGGREWTIDGSGELLIVERPRGDAMPKTVVSALYNFRDVKDNEDDDARGAHAEADGGGGRGARRKGSSSASTLLRDSEQTGSATRRTSRRRGSRRVVLGSRRGSGLFFELEPTLQPNLTNSVDRPGAGVSVSDGSSFKEGPSWPQDPDHMSRSEYRERQRKQDLSDVSTLDHGEDASTLGFSLGSVQSAPALRGLGLGQSGSGGVVGAGSSAGGGGGRRALSGGGGGGSRGTSITAFENVNPFEGGVRVASPTPQKSGETAGGDLSPLSASVGGQSGGRFFPVAGPETWSSVGEDDDPHLALTKDPDWGRNVGGRPKEAGYLPKGGGGAKRDMRSHGVVNMAKPKEILVEGLLR
eukprot:g2259.t1